MCVYLSMAIEKQNQKCASCFNYLQLCETPWTAVCQVPLSMEFSRQEYWNVLPFPSPEVFLTQKLNLGLLHCRQILYC